MIQSTYATFGSKLSIVKEERETKQEENIKEKKEDRGAKLSRSTSCSVSHKD